MRRHLVNFTGVYLLNDRYGRGTLIVAVGGSRDTITYRHVGRRLGVSLVFWARKDQAVVGMKKIDAVIVVSADTDFALKEGDYVHPPGAQSPNQQQKGKNRTVTEAGCSNHKLR